MSDWQNYIVVYSPALLPIMVTLVAFEMARGKQIDLPFRLTFSVISFDLWLLTNSIRGVPLYRNQSDFRDTATVSVVMLLFYLSCAAIQARIRDDLNDPSLSDGRRKFHHSRLWAICFSALIGPFAYLNYLAGKVAP